MWFWDLEKSKKEKNEMRVKIREGLESVDFRAGTLSGLAAGALYVPASRNDLKHWIDAKTFNSGTRISRDNFRLSHKNNSCSGSEIIVTQDVDRPNIKLTCNHCLRSWQVHQLESLPPKSFSAIFEYRLNFVDEDWPSIFVTKSNGVTKYSSLVKATTEQAAEYFVRAFDMLRKNGFRKVGQ